MDDAGIRERDREDKEKKGGRREELEEAEKVLRGRKRKFKRGRG